MADSPQASATADDLLDERLIQNRGFGGYAAAALNRLKGGELGSFPVVIGMIVISIVFYSIEPRFLSSFTLTNIFAFAAPVGLISLGIVLVLLLGEIDLSVGSVSGLAAASMAVLVVNKGASMTMGVVAGILVGLVIGAFYALLYTKIGVPSFVFSLAGLLAFQGVLLYVLGDQGTINLPSDSWLVQFARFKFLTGTPAYAAVILVAVGYVLSSMYGLRRRAAAELSTQPLAMVLAKGALLAVGLLALTWYLQQGQGRGWSYLVLLFAAAVVVMDLALRKTRWGRHVFAVGGNVEAARRAGIKVDRIYYSVFGLCSMFAALGGLMLAGQLTSVSQASGTTDTNLTAIAAAVIGGTSLFGGRGSAYSAMLGIVVLQAIQSGLNIIAVDSSVRFIVTGGVLLLATIIDSLSRRRRTSSGRG